jgi:hypothetical protein
MVKCWMSEWLLLNANSAIFQLYNGYNKLFCNEMKQQSADTGAWGQDTASPFLHPTPFFTKKNC